MIIILIKAMKDVDSMTVISVKFFCEVIRPALHASKQLTAFDNIRKVIKCNQLHYFNKVTEILQFKLGSL